MGLLSQEERKVKMSKLLIKINDDKELTYDTDGFILGLNNYSICFSKYYDIDQIKKIKDTYKDKEIFVSLNRNIFNDELNDYKKILGILDDLGLNGIIVSDISALTYKLKTPIILDQYHLNNSYLSINHYACNGCSGVFLTNDITGDEIKEIRKNTNALLFKEVLGLEHLSTSVRKLVSNYLEFINSDKKSSRYFIKEPKSDCYYNVIEDYFGTHIFGNKVLNLLNYNIDVNYLVVDSFLLDKDNFKMVLDSYLSGNKIDNNLFEFYDGFYNKKTIYKVKNNE